MREINYIKLKYGPFYENGWLIANLVKLCVGVQLPVLGLAAWPAFLHRPRLAVSSIELRHGCCSPQHLIPAQSHRLGWWTTTKRRCPDRAPGPASPLFLLAKWPVCESESAVSELVTPAISYHMLHTCHAT